MQYQQQLGLKSGLDTSLVTILRYGLCLVLLGGSPAHSPIRFHADASPVHHQRDRVPTSQKDAQPSERGLVAFASDASYHDTDLDTFTQSGSDLVWYYNYDKTATDHLTTTSLQYSPMLYDADGNDNFGNEIISQVQGGSAISTILFLNEPDQCGGGGVCLAASDAANLWNAQIAPIKSAYPNISISSPATTGSPQGYSWLQDFFSACNGGCQHDFVATHFYGDSAGLQSWLEQLSTTFVANSTNQDLWLTEWGYPNQDLETTQDFYNTTIAYLDSTSFVSRDSYFGSFRSSDSNVGPNEAMLDSTGALTLIGGLYLNVNGPNATP